MALRDKKLDVRIRDKQIHEGKVKTSELEKFTKSLPDDAENLVFTDAIDCNTPGLTGSVSELKTLESKSL
jgi:hypothetical protein